MNSLESQVETNLGATATLHRLLGFASSSPFPFAGPTSLRLRRQREQRSKDRAVAAAAASQLAGIGKGTRAPLRTA